MTYTGGAYAPKRTRIGVITNTRELVRRTVEQTACNYNEITVPAWCQTVLYLDDRGDLYWSYEGTCTDEHWVNRMLGMERTREDKPNVGKPMTDHHRAYDYTLLALMLSGEWNVKLDDNIEVTAEVKNVGGHTSSVFAQINLKTEVPA